MLWGQHPRTTSWIAAYMDRRSTVEIAEPVPPVPRMYRRAHLSSNAIVGRPWLGYESLPKPLGDCLNPVVLLNDDR